MADIPGDLERTYCPPLDSALLYAILSDFDVHDSTALQEVRANLDALKDSALIEEQTDFDPSGSGAYTLGLSAEGAAQRAESCPESRTSPSQDTDATSISNDLSSLDIGDGNLSGSETDRSPDHGPDLDALDDETKKLLLKDIFLSATDYTISYILKKCNGRWSQALEELLNHVYFEEAEQSGDPKIFTKSIDAFSEDNTIRRGRKGKGKRRKNDAFESGPRTGSLPPDDHGEISTINRWQTTKKDVDFITSRTGLSVSSVSSIYHKSGASVPAAIAAILKAQLDEHENIVSTEPKIQTAAFELGQEFPTIAPSYLAALMRLTHPSTASAHELAVALTAQPTPAQGGIQIQTQYTPIDLSSSPPPHHQPQHRHSSAINTADASTLAAAYSSARSAAFSQARAAYRKSKSDHLMSGAAGYYSQVGREASASLASYNSAAADALVDGQSTPTQLDLHGVNVKDAVRIASERVGRWWSGLGEARINGRVGAGVRQEGFRIVTGKGMHSEGGRSKIGPAVGRMLVQEGWKVEAGSGAYTVTGRVRPK
ncbi:hypothetical protein LTR66_005805 [Elasticomyces elasticus]|nr:hypothetical protein LTR66_005805 [Elasticomyces elasticus]